MANDENNTVDKCMSCSRNRRTKKEKKKLRLFPPVSPEDFVAIHIVGPLPKTEGGSKFIVIITGRYSKLTKDIPTAKATSTRIANIFMEHWLATLGVPLTKLTGNGPQFTFNFIVAHC